MDKCLGLSSSSAASTSSGEQEICKKRKSQPIRKYSKEYLQYGFTFTMDENTEAKPQCLVCNEVLTNHSMKPSLLKRHFLGKHNSLKDKPVTLKKFLQICNSHVSSSENLLLRMKNL